MALRASSESLPLADLIQSTANARRTGRLVAAGPEGDGQIYFEGGRIVHAVYGDLVGADAIYAMVAATELEYQVEPDIVTRTRTIRETWQELLLEAARRQDEGSLIRPTTPARLEPSASSSASISGSSASVITGTNPIASASHTREPSTPTATARTSSLPSVEAERGIGKLVIWAALGVVLAIVAVLIGVELGSRGGEDELAEGERPASDGAEPVATQPLDGTIHEAADLEQAGGTPPKVDHAVSAVAPRTTSLDPSVVVRVHLDRQGKVVESKIYRSRTELADFEQAALDAIEHYRFTAASLDGQAVEAWINVPVRFEQADPRGRRAVRIKGSDTIGGDLGPALAKAYGEIDGHVLVTVEALGSSTGFAGLLDGSAEIGASSRAVSEAELSAAAKQGVALREFVIGYDGIAVIVHPENPITQLSLGQLAAVFTGEVSNWKELGGPDLAIVRLSRSKSSGTHDFFTSKVLRADAADSAADFAERTSYIESSQELAAQVADDPGAIGYLGAAWASDAVKVLAISPVAGKPASEPTLDSISAGTYPIYRPLLLYTRNQPSRDTIAFLRFVLGEQGQALVAEHGFVPVGAQGEESLPSLAEASAEAPSLRVTQVFFEPGATELSAQHEVALKALVSAPAQGTPSFLLVGSSTGEEGDASVAMLRAKAVAEFLGDAGVAEQRVVVRGAASERAPTREGSKAELRRVDVYVSSTAE